MAKTTRARAVGFLEPGPPEVLEDIVVDLPAPGGNDLLVEVRAISVNPADAKSRASDGAPAPGVARVLGYDAAGVVVATGPDARRFTPGDEVFYAGSIGRRGTYASHHLVDENVVGPKPRSLDFADAAALPLTAITAWETLFDRLALPAAGARGTLLVMGAAGGVGSMILQLARARTDLTLLATAARGASADWVTELGAHHVVDRHDLVETVRAVAPADGVDFVFSPFSAANIDNYAALLRPRGEIVAIDDPVGLDLLPLKLKSITWHWELMFTRPLLEPDDPYQHDLLVAVAALADRGAIRSTRTRTLHGITAATLQEAHRAIETSASIGKLVVTAA